MKNTNKGYVIICIYIDDMLILDSNVHMIKSTKKILTNKFDMKNLDVTDIILGIKISNTSNGLVLPQSYYVEKILKNLSKYDNNIDKTLVVTYFRALHKQKKSERKEKIQKKN
jgi:DNA polymerase III delta prime subunit